ncbi:MAG: EAL domain-containing protein [Lysobacterales bacterium]
MNTGLSARANFSSLGDRPLRFCGRRTVTVPALTLLLAAMLSQASVVAAPERLASASQGNAVNADRGVERGYYFARVGQPGELAQNTVNALLQDRAGFLWVATQGGLHRYDGYGFLRFQHVPGDTGSLPDNFVTALAEDSEGHLFAGSIRHGLARWYPEERRFRAIALGSGETARREVITELLADANGGLWIGSHFGLEYLDRHGQLADVLRLPPAARGTTSVTSLTRCGNGDVYAASSDGLFRIQAGQRRARRYLLPEQGLQPRVVHCDVTGTLWIAAGLQLFERQRDHWRLALDAASTHPPLAHVDFERIAEDHARNLWLSTDGGGLVKFAPDEVKVEVLRHNQRIDGSLPEDRIQSLLVDRSGLLWIGGLITGLSRAQPDGAYFTSLFDDSQGSSRPAANNIFTMFAEGERGLWIGTDGDGLKFYDWASGRFTRFGAELGRALGLPRAPPNLRVRAIARAAAEGQYWVTSNLGVFLLDPDKRSATALPVAIEREDALPSADTHALLVGHDGSVWIGTHGHGLLRYQPASGQWQRYPAATTAGQPGLWDASVVALHEDSERRLWIGTISGLNVLEQESGRLLKIRRGSQTKGDLAGEVVRAIIETADGSLWVGTHNGLNRMLDYRQGDPLFQHFLVRDGLQDDTIYGILEDGERQLWISTNSGISRIEFAARNPQQAAAPGAPVAIARVRNYQIADGLPGLEFNGNAFAKGDDGRLFFGASAGLVWLDPKRPPGPAFQAPLAFTSYQIGSQRTDVLDSQRFTKIVLSERERVLMLAFTALDLNAPEQNRFAYRLLGFDDTWIDLGNRHEVAFTRLSPGRYQLQVRGSNRDRISSDRPLELAIEVVPRWWQTRWSQAAALLLLLTAASSWWASRRQRVREAKLKNQQLALYSERLASALWASRDGYWDWDIESDMVYLAGPEEFLGPEREMRMSGRDWRRNVVHADDLAQVEASLEKHIQGSSSYYEAEYRVRTGAGRYPWIRARGRVIRRDAAGHALQVAGTFRDVSEQRARDRDRLIAAEVIRSMGEVVCVTDLEFRFVSINATFTRVIGYQADEVIGVDAAILNSEQHPADFYLQLRQSLEERAHWRGEAWQKRKNGESILTEIEINPVCDDFGQRLYWVAVITDITDRKRAEQELRYLANYDTLTGLPNRTLLGERLAHSLIRARRLGNRVALLFLDLDRFKHVNDSMGHAAGDRLLKAVAARIVCSVRQSDTVARLGGDEFTVVLEDIRDTLEAERVANKLLADFQKPLEIDGRNEVVISPSIGIALYPEHGQVPTDLLKHADTAMYHAKDRGRNTYQVYNDAMDAQVRFRASIGNQLHKALERNELHLVFQPKLSLSDQRITGAEALLRWHNPVLGELSPSVFIPIAEESGLIVPIGEWVLREACTQIKRWTKAGLETQTIAVNVSAMQLFRGELAAHMQQILQEFEVAPERLEIELTESMLMAHPEQSIATLTQISQLGVRIAIDDFGTGYSSLAYLKRLPIDALKIDQTFVADLSIDPDDEAIIATVIVMAHSLGLDVIAEGVETLAQMRFLASHGCDHIQGHLVSHPLSAEHILLFLKERAASMPLKGASDED